MLPIHIFFFFFFNDPATTEIYPLPLPDALPIFSSCVGAAVTVTCSVTEPAFISTSTRSEEHTSELQSRSDLVCRLLLEKKKKEVLTIMSTMIQTNSSTSLYVDFIGVVDTNTTYI